MPDTPFDATGRLARRVLDGEVVFFVGSGFSIDSEGNAASRLVGRLLAALLAMGTVLAESAAGADSQAVSLLDGLTPVFGIKGASRPGDIARQPALCMTKANLDLIARDYYNFNEWSVSALGVLSEELLARPDRAALADRMQRLATFLLALVDDTVPLDRIDCDAIAGFGTDAGARGKAVFLDVMGFANLAIMAGTPGEKQVTDVADSYKGRLRPRHHVLARLAREGLASAVVTTNYDLLLEGAYRLAGFVDRENRELAPDGMPPDRVARFTRITGATEFFARGQGYRTALLLKIHGCAQTYRDVRSRQIQVLRSSTASSNATVNEWAEYLSALVFTYREIQTWRADAWSRDLVRTLLRTHTIALCGYSGADPIMHSTFREVFEEKAASQRTVRLRRSDDGPQNASVFFYGLAGKREFYSLEILRAATAAGGFGHEELLKHPNHIEFERESGFPNVDDHFRWLMHCVVRQLQSDALETQIRRLKPRFFRGLQCKDSEFVTARDRFKALREAERDVVGATVSADDKRPASARRRQLDLVVGWTWHFVPGLLREIALAEVVESYQGGGRAFQAKRTWSYYHPASEHLDRTAWAAIVEMAIRRLVASVRGGHELAVGDAVAEESPYAAMSFNTGDDPPRPSALCVRLAGFERPFGRTPLIGAFHRTGYWELSPRDVPWPLTRTDWCPGPEDIWGWALDETPPGRTTAAQELAGRS